MWRVLLIVVALGAGGCRTGQPSVSLPDASVEVLIEGHLNGSGCIADPSGLVLTADHVARGREDLPREVLWQGRRLPVQFVARDVLHDIALLQLPAELAPYPCLAVALAAPEADAVVRLHGSAQFDHDVRLHGFAASETPSYRYFPDRLGFMCCWLINGFSPPGTSGGAWVDGTGRIVGVQSGFVNYKDASMSGLALVAPADAIRALLATRQTIERPRLGCGLEELWSQSAGFIARFPPGTEGLATVPLEEDGPVAQAGLTRESLIVAADGKPVRYRRDLLDEVYRHQPGDILELRVLAPDTTEPTTVTVTLGTMP